MSLSSYKLNASIAVSDMAQAGEFYEGKLGLSPLKTGPDRSRVYGTGGNTSLAVYLSPDNAGQSPATMASWNVDDVQETVDELTAEGVTFEHYEAVLPNGFEFASNEKGISPRGGGGKIAWFKDPDGNIFAIEGDH